MGNGCDVCDAGDCQTVGGKCADSGFPAGTGAFYEDIDCLEAVDESCLGSCLAGHLRRVGRGFMGALEAEAS